MPNFARIVDGVAIDVCTDPAQFFHPDIAAEFVEVADTVRAGSRRDDEGIWTDPPAAIPPANDMTGRAIVGPNEFYFLWTIPEQVAIDSLRETDIVIKLFMRRLDDPKTTEVVLASVAVQGAVTHTVEALVTKGVIKEEDKEARIAQILSGQEPS